MRGFHGNRAQHTAVLTHPGSRGDRQGVWIVGVFIKQSVLFADGGVVHTVR